MLYVNETALNKSNKEYADLFKDYQEKVSEYKKKYGKTITFLSLYKPYAEGAGQTDRTGRPILVHPRKNISLIFTAKESREGFGELQWRYSDVGRQIKHTKEGSYEFWPNISDPNLKSFRDQWTLSLDQYSDLVYFIIEKSNWIGRHMEISDPEGKAKEFVDTQAPEADLKYFIYGSGSPINPKNDGGRSMRMIASAWGVRDAHKLGESSLKIELANKVKELHAKRSRTGKGIPEFLNDVFDINKGKEKDLKVRAAIRQAIDENYIKYDPAEYSWKWTEGNKTLCSISVDEVTNRQERLYKYLMSSPKELDRVIAILGEDSIEDITLEKVKAMSYQQAYEYCDERGWVQPGKPMKEADLKARIIGENDLE